MSVWDSFPDQDSGSQDVSTDSSKSSVWDSFPETDQKQGEFRGTDTWEDAKQLIPGYGAPSEFKAGLNSGEQILGDNMAGKALGGALGAARAAGTVFNPIGKSLGMIPRMAQAAGSLVAGDPRAAGRDLTGSTPIQSGAEIGNLDTGNSLIDVPINGLSGIYNEAIAKQPLSLAGLTPEALSEQGAAIRSVSKGIGEGIGVIKKPIAQTTPVMGDLVKKPNSTEPVEIHDMMDKESENFLNKLSKPKDSRSVEMNKQAYAEAVRADPVNTNTTEGLELSLNGNLKDISNMYEQVKKNPTPVNYDAVANAVDGVKGTFDKGTQMTKDNLLNQYKGKVVDLSTAIADENNANATYRQMVLKYGQGSHEAQMYSVVRDVLSDMVDKGFKDSGIPNSEKIGMIYRGTKNLLKSIDQAQIKASIDAAKGTGHSPVSVWASLYGASKLAKGIFTGNPVDLAEGAAVGAGVIKNLINKRNIAAMKNPDYIAQKLHSKLTSKLGFDHPITGKDFGSPQTQPLPPKFNPMSPGAVKRIVREEAPISGEPQYKGMPVGPSPRLPYKPVQFPRIRPSDTE